MRHHRLSTVYAGTRGPSRRIPWRRFLLLAALALPVSHAVAGTPTATFLYVSVSGSDTGRCSAEAPCQTIGRAYALAAPGATIELASGDYPAQRVVSNGERTGPAVVVRPAAGSSVRLAGLALGDPELGNGPSWLEFHDLAIVGGSIEVLENTHDVVLAGMSAANFYVRGARHITFSGGSYGPCTTDGVTAHCGNNKVDVSTARWPTSDITIEDVLFHDYRIVPGSGAHFECLFLRGGEGVSVLRSRFVNCEFFNLFVQWSGSPMDDLRIDGNHFEPSFDGAGNRRSLTFLLSGGGYTWTNLSITHNSFAQSDALLDDGTQAGFSNVVVARNVFDGSLHCFAGVRYHDNLTRDTGCDPTDRRRVYGYELESGRLVPVDAETAAVRRIFDRTAAGSRASEIARGLRGTAGRPPGGWSAAKVKAILADPVYMGGYYGPKGTQTPLVTIDKWVGALLVRLGRT